MLEDRKSYRVGEMVISQQKCAPGLPSTKVDFEEKSHEVTDDNMISQQIPSPRVPPVLEIY